MTLAPLMERELRAAVRTGWARMRVWTALSDVLLTMLHLSLPGNAHPSSISQELFHMLLVFSIGGAVLQTIRFSLDLVARERRNQTLGLLVLTGLSSGEIFLAKFGGALVVQLCCGLALLPCFAVSFVLGGVPVSAFLAAAILIPNLTILTLTVCLVASTLSRDEDGAMALAALLGGIIALGAPAVQHLSQWALATPLSRDWLLWSPVYGCSAVWDFLAGTSPAQFWMNSGLIACYSAGLVIASGFLLQRAWRQDAGEVRTLVPPVEALVRPVRSRFSKSRPDRQWLDLDPFIWLTLRHQRSVPLAWLAVSALTAT